MSDSNDESRTQESGDVLTESLITDVAILRASHMMNLESVVSKTFFILTVRGDVGPMDQEEMRKLLSDGSINSTDQVRNAFGRMLGTVAENIGRSSPPYHAARSDRRRAVANPHRTTERPFTFFSPRLMVISAVLGLALLIALTTGLATSRRDLPQQQQQQANLPQTPSMVSAPRPNLDNLPPSSLGQGQVSTQRQPTVAPVLQQISHCTIITAVDNTCECYLNGVMYGKGSSWQQTVVGKNLALRPGKNVLAIKCYNKDQQAGMIADIRIGTQRLASNASFRITTSVPANGWQNLDFDDSSWVPSKELGKYGVLPWKKQVSGFPTDSQARWIWAAKSTDNQTLYVRFTFTNPAKQDSKTP